MREVSAKAVAFVRDASLRANIDFRDISRGLRGIETLDDSSGRVDWDPFADLLDRFAARGGGMASLEQAGMTVADAPFAESIRVIAGAFTSSRTLFRAIAKWFAPSALRNLVIAYDDLPDGRIRIVVDIAEPHRPSVPFFHMTAGSYRVAPRLLGQPDAVVEMHIDGRRATYLIAAPPDLTLAARGKRGLKLLLGARRAIDELSRQQAELRASYDALVASRRDFRRVIDSVPTGVLIHRDGVILYANPSWSATLGFDPAGRRVEDLVAPEARDRVAPLLSPSAATGLTVPRVETPFLHARGDVVVVELAPSQPVEFDGEPAAVLVGHDVTEQRAMQAKSQVADRMASIGTIAAGVAHEINNPLTYVIDNVRRLGAELDAGVAAAAEMRQLVAEAVSGIERVELIVRDLKMFSRAEVDSVGVVDVGGVIESTARIAANEVRVKARLVVDLADVPATLGHPTRLGQVILNLLLNAAQAIPDGAPERNRIDIVARRVKETIVIEIRDTGAGIQPQNLSRVFEPFFTTKPLGRGTGLGLAVCHQIVTGMGGTIAIESRIGEGTTVRLSLPATARVAATPSLEPPPAPSTTKVVLPAGARKRILIVDDEPLVARALQRALRGHDVTVAHGGTEALDVLRADAFDVILCDLMMPGMSGIDLYEQLPGEQRRRFVFATGGAFNQRAQQFLAEVPNQRIDKPFDPKQVAKMVEEFQPQ